MNEEFKQWLEEQIEFEYSALKRAYKLKQLGWERAPILITRASTTLALLIQVKSRYEHFEQKAIS